MRFSIVSICFIFLFSCAVEKRHYREGYAVKWNSKKNPGEQKNLIQVKPHYDLTASVSEAIPDPVLFTHIGYSEKPGNRCDTIFLKSGAKLLASVKEVKETEVKYRACDDRGGEGFVLLKTEVTRIHYGNGEVDNFTEEDPVDQGSSGQGRNGSYGSPWPPPPVSSGFGISNENVNREISQDANKSLAFGIASCAPLFIISLILSGIAIHSGRRVNEKLHGKPGSHQKEYNKSRAGIILAIINIALRVLLIAIVIIAVVGIL